MRQPHRFPIAFIFLFLLSLPHPAPASEDAQKPRSFAATGLLLHQDERAEEILLRAHAYDTDAIALTIAGYRQEINGFPRNGGLAGAWAIMAAENLGLSSTAAFFQILSDNGQAPSEEESADWLAVCEFARQSRYAPIFKESGLFDVDRQCKALEPYKQNTVEWRKEYDDSLKIMAKKAESIREVITLIRELPHRAMTDQDAQLLREHQVGRQSLFFFAATSHDPESQSPDWKAERLFDFIAMRRAENTVYADTLAAGALEAVLQRLAGSSDLLVQEIRQAHSGRHEAEAFLALQYLSGAMSFPKNIGIAAIWLKNAADSGDSHFVELRAIQLFGTHPYFAWPWARSAEKSGDTDARDRARHLMQIIEREHPREALEKAFGQ